MSRKLIIWVTFHFFLNFAHAELAMKFSSWSSQEALYLPEEMASELQIMSILLKKQICHAFFESGPDLNKVVRDCKRIETGIGHVIDKSIEKGPQIGCTITSDAKQGEAPLRRLSSSAACSNREG